MSTSTDRHWLEVAEKIGERSKCSRKKLGAVIIQGGRLVSAGYNGAPKGFPDDMDQSCRLFCPAAALGISASTDGYALCVAVHAEVNALLFANRQDLQGATIYVPYSVCFNCAKAIANSGITRLVWRPTHKHVETENQVANFLMTCGLEVCKA